MKKTITLEELKKMPPISEERLKEIEEFKEDFSDPEIPPMTHPINDGRIVAMMAPS